MSILKALKDTVCIAQQDVLDRIKSLTAFHEFSQNVTPRDTDSTHVSVGDKLLCRYQKCWSDLHNYTMESARRAEIVDETFKSVDRKIEKQYRLTVQLQREVTTMPSLLLAVRDMASRIGSLRDDFRAVEEALDRLANVHLEQSSEREKIQREHRLAQYIMSKRVKELTVKNTLWKQLEDKATALEREREASRREKDSALTIAAAHDLDYYRIHGHVPENIGKPMNAYCGHDCLEDVIIDDDTSSLEAFLNDDTDNGALEAVTACSSEERSEYIACCSQPGGSFLAKQSSSSEALESEDPGEDTACETPGFNRLLNGACLVNDVERVQSWT